jgi:hypothetical protein
MVFLVVGMVVGYEAVLQGGLTLPARVDRN